jgi:hypothetical protein
MNRRLILASALALSTAATLPAPAQAECLAEAVASCNADFPGTTNQIIGIRGWCMLIRSGICGIFDAY